MSKIKLRNNKNEALSFDYGGRRLIVAPHTIIELEQEDYRELCQAHNVHYYLTEVVAEIEATTPIKEEVIAEEAVVESKDIVVEDVVTEDIVEEEKEDTKKVSKKAK